MVLKKAQTLTRPSSTIRRPRGTRHQRASAGESKATAQHPDRSAGVAASCYSPLYSSSFFTTSSSSGFLQTTESKAHNVRISSCRDARSAHLSWKILQFCCYVPHSLDHVELGADTLMCHDQCLTVSYPHNAGIDVQSIKRARPSCGPSAEIVRAAGAGRDCLVCRLFPMRLHKHSY
jgi:hypothetical protein